MDNVTAYWNGDWVDCSSLKLALDDYGVLMGVSVVERLRTFNHATFRTEQHLARLRRSIEIVGWDTGRLVNDVRQALAGFVQQNASLMEAGDDWTIVVFITPGATFDGSKPNVCVHGGPLPFADWSRQYAEGLDAVIVDVRQTPGNCWPADLKCRSRMHYYLADREAQQRIPGARAILLDQQGFIAEGSTANVVAYFQDRGLIAPKVENVLPGISQAALFEIAEQAGIPCSEADLTPEQFCQADEAYFVSTSICLVPIVRLTGEPVGAGNVGPFYKKLLAAWSRSVGVEIDAQAEKFRQR